MINAIFTCKIDTKRNFTKKYNHYITYLCDFGLTDGDFNILSTTHRDT